MSGRWLLATGGRTYYLTAEDRRWLDELDEEYDFDVLVHGGATGADEGAAKWFVRRRWDQGRPSAVLTFLPFWGSGGQGGPQRNAYMVDLCAATKPQPVCAVFPGGAGTAGCARLARAAGLRVMESPSRAKMRAKSPGGDPGSPDHEP